MGGGINKLSAMAVQRAKKPGYYGDGGGLWLQISKLGGKSWVFRYTAVGKAREMGLGAAHTVTLAEARTKALDCRKAVLDGKDPIAQRKAEQASAQAQAAKAKTFQDCAEAYIEANRAGWKNEKHAAQWTATLEAYAHPKIGQISVGAVDTGSVLAVLQQPVDGKPLWLARNETASRLRGRIESILDWAAFRGFRPSGDNPARWKGHLEHELPARSRVQKTQHHAALPYTQAASFMQQLASQDGVAARAVELIILTACRTGEVFNATRSEFDLEAKLWTIPAARMKAGKEHVVPLSPKAARLIEDSAAMQGPEFVFPGGKARSPLSNMAGLALLKRMGFPDLTVHGFRSTFRDWAGEQTSYPREVIEHALAHQLKDKAEAAYQRGTLLDKRRALMLDWASYVDQPRADPASDEKAGEPKQVAASYDVVTLSTQPARGRH